MKSNVEQIMSRKRLTVRKLALISGVPMAIIDESVVHIESCTISRLEKIAKALGCKVKDLFEEE